jgi:hypothetical protein
MAYIGNNLTVQQYAPTIASFTGDGSTTAFTLPVAVVSAAQIIVTVNNVIQNPNYAYTVSGTTLTFTSAPPANGTTPTNIWVEYTSLQTNLIQPAASTVGISQLSATGAPSSSTYLRGDNTWAAAGVPTIYGGTILVIGGGGGGGWSDGGGGGAGGYVTGGVVLITGKVYTATIGAGGAGQSVSVTPGGTGNQSLFTGTFTALGGGGGASQSGNASQGASGGGGAYNSASQEASSLSNQGSYGGHGNNYVSGAGAATGGGGGGGYSGTQGIGGTGTNSSAGAGGAGVVFNITGSNVTYCGGGGGGGYIGSGGAGGAGGGGAGGTTSVSGTAGTANTGGGGGGGGDTASASVTGGNGGSGVVILSVPTANYSGTTTGSPTITTSGSNTIIKFTASGTYTA